jgi:hypothetical protein
MKITIFKERVFVIKTVEIKFDFIQLRELLENGQNFNHQN